MALSYQDPAPFVAAKLIKVREELDAIARRVFADPGAAYALIEEKLKALPEGEGVSLILGDPPSAVPSDPPSEDDDGTDSWLSYNEYWDAGGSASVSVGESMGSIVVPLIYLLTHTEPETVPGYDGHESISDMALEEVGCYEANLAFAGTDPLARLETALRNRKHDYGAVFTSIGNGEFLAWDNGFVADEFAPPEAREPTDKPGWFLRLVERYLENALAQQEREERREFDSEEDDDEFEG